MSDGVDGKLAINITRKELLQQLTTRGLYQLFNGVMDIVEACQGSVVAVDAEQPDRIHPSRDEGDAREEEA